MFLKSRILNIIFPPQTHCRMLMRVLIRVFKNITHIGAILCYENLKNFWKYSNFKFRCNVCGVISTPLYDFPDITIRKQHEIAILRETLQCKNCNASMRERTLSYLLLEHLNNLYSLSIVSLRDLSGTNLISSKILDTDDFSSISKILKRINTIDYTRSIYSPNSSYEKIQDNLFGLDLTKMNIQEQFDIILTSDVMEHVRDCDAASKNIYKALKENGAYIFTVPFNDQYEDHRILVDTSGSEDIYLEEPHFHGDPMNKSTGILAYRVFGRSLIKDLDSMGFSTCLRNINSPENLIIDGDAFIALKKTR